MQIIRLFCHGKYDKDENVWELSHAESISGKVCPVLKFLAQKICTNLLQSQSYNIEKG